MAISEEDFERSTRAAERPRPRAVRARYDKRSKRVVVSLDTGIDIAFRPDHAEGLLGASATALAKIELSPRGLGLHWPDLDVDLTVAGLLEGHLGSVAWMAQALGARGGSARTPIKVAAARNNGLKGGRPKRVA